MCSNEILAFVNVPRINLCYPRNRIKRVIQLLETEFMVIYDLIVCDINSCHTSSPHLSLLKLFSTGSRSYITVQDWDVSSYPPQIQVMFSIEPDQSRL
jgi:hypothetical protein